MVCLRRARALRPDGAMSGSRALRRVTSIPLVGRRGLPRTGSPIASSSMGTRHPRSVGGTGGEECKLWFGVLEDVTVTPTLVVWDLGKANPSMGEGAFYASDCG